MSVALFANIFSQSEGCLFILLVVYFAVQKHLSLTRSHLFIFTLGGGSKKILLWFMSESVLPMFSFNSFTVSVFTLRLLIHLEFIFVYGVRECSNFILLHVAVQLSKHHLLKKLPFPIVYSCLLCHSDHRCVCLSLGFLSYSFYLYFCFCASTIVFWWL